MTPVFACFPICLTFVSLGLVLLVVVATGLHHPRGGAVEPRTDATPDLPGTGPPPAWVVVLIFAAVLVHFALLLWLWPEL